MQDIDYMNTPLFVWDVPTGKLIELGGGLGQNSAYSTGLFAWSPDGRLAWVNSKFVSTGGSVLANPISTIYLADAAFTKKHELLTINHAIDKIGWSPVNNHLAFQTYAGLYIADVETGIFRDFIQGLGKLDGFNWSPDGNYVGSVISGIPGKWTNDIVLAAIRSGANYRYSTNDQHYISSTLRWNPDSNGFIVSSGLYGSYMLTSFTLP